MWRFGQGRPRMVSIAKAEMIKQERISRSGSWIRAGEIRKLRSKAAAAAGAAESGGGAQ